jgi:DNA-binding Xre family transcriptional regulator
MDTLILFRWNIRNICLLRGIKTQKKLADISGADKNLVNDIWNSRQRSVSIKTLGKICVALNCTPSDVLSFELATPVREM